MHQESSLLCDIRISNQNLWGFSGFWTHTYSIHAVYHLLFINTIFTRHINISILYLDHKNSYSHDVLHWTYKYIIYLRGMYCTSHDNNSNYAPYMYMCIFNASCKLWSVFVFVCSRVTLFNVCILLCDTYVAY